MFHRKKEHIVVIITAGARSYMEKVPESPGRIRRSPDYYRDIEFTLDSRESLEPYRRHFIYHYLETLHRADDLPAFILTAEKLVITVTKEK